MPLSKKQTNIPAIRATKLTHCLGISLYQIALLVGLFNISLLISQVTSHTLISFFIIVMWSNDAYDAAADHALRARLLTACSPGYGDGSMHCVCRERNCNWTVRMLLDCALVCQLFNVTCVCGSTVTVDGHHGPSCRYTQPAQQSTLSRFHKHMHLAWRRVNHTRCAPCSGGQRPDGVM